MTSAIRERREQEVLSRVQPAKRSAVEARLLKLGDWYLEQLESELGIERRSTQAPTLRQSQPKTSTPKARANRAAPNERALLCPCGCNTRRVLRAKSPEALEALEEKLRDRPHPPAAVRNGVRHSGPVAAPHFFPPVS